MLTRNLLRSLVVSILSSLKQLRTVRGAELWYRLRRTSELEKFRVAPGADAYTSPLQPLPLAEQRLPQGEYEQAQSLQLDLWMRVV